MACRMRKCFSPRTCLKEEIYPRYQRFKTLHRIVDNISHCQVALCIYSLARATQKHPEFSGPSLGPKFATKNERNFSEEQIRKGRDGVLGLQTGSNKGASQVNSENNTGTFMTLLDSYLRPDTVAWEILDTCKTM